jgi:hypothetical protein
MSKVGALRLSEFCMRLIINLRVGRACSFQGIESRGESSRPVPSTDAQPLSVPSMLSVDPFSQDTLRASFLDIAVRDEAVNILGEMQELEDLVRRFFSTVYIRVPFISQRRFRVNLPYVYSRPRADYLLLCLSISLVLQRPREINFPGETMQSSLYVTVKCLIASLEAAGVLTLGFVQARALVCFYEIGHGIYPAAAASLAACASSARLLGLENRRSRKQHPEVGDLAGESETEEKKRTLWAIVNMDRYVLHRPMAGS